METNQQPPQEALCQEILAEARRECDEILLRARQEAERLMAESATGVQKERQEILNTAHEEATRRKELILSSVPVEAGRRRSARIEGLLQAIHDEALGEISSCNRAQYREIIIALAADAVSRMEGDSFVVKLAPDDKRSLGEDLAGEIIRRSNRSPLSIKVTEEQAIACGGGVIVEAAGGHQVWDNRFEARLERLWPELRQEIAIQTGLVPGNNPAGDGR